jgi:hypothetical protein
MTQAGGTAQSGGTSDLETHLKIQKRIWEVMATVRPKSDAKDDGAWPGPVEGSKRGVTSPTECAGPPNSVVVCPAH